MVNRSCGWFVMPFAAPISARHQASVQETAASGAGPVKVFTATLPGSMVEMSTGIGGGETTFDTRPKFEGFSTESRPPKMHGIVLAAFARPSFADSSTARI